MFFFFFQAEDGIRDIGVTGVQTCALPIYNFLMDEADAFKTLVVRVKNHNRYKDYFMKVRKRIPVYGADFDQPTLYNFSGDHLYADYRSLLTRCGDFDGQHVLVVSRATKPHLLKVSDLKQGKIAPIMLDLTDVSGGTYAYNMGALANGHVYLATDRKSTRLNSSHANISYAVF